MANIDTSAIEGYESMTPEQKIAALEGYRIPDPDYSGYIKKSVFDKTASELSELKKQHNATLSAEELAKQEAAEAAAAKDEQIANLTRQVSVNNHVNNFLALGYDADLAKSTAEAMVDGKMDVVFANQKIYNEKLQAKIKADLLKGTPGPVGGNGNEDVDYAAEADKALKAGNYPLYSHYARLVAEQNTKK